MYDPYQITPQLQQPIAAGTMNPNMNPQDEAMKRQKMMMMAEALRGMQPQQQAMDGEVTPAMGNPLGTAMGSFGNTFGMMRK